ncbi:cob(I)yrinic acid a,c-diamide adenosyltransferase [Candidatus Peregrinibacteria bacterium]|nr:cob(I)yrinic acid a,c-diamide adenosyltransferase [Candidatus Peregrinibacteria bacterium]
MSIYTKTGDLGETGLADGKRLPKNHQRIEALGAVDELSCAIGVLRAHSKDENLNRLLVGIQNELSGICAEFGNSKLAKPLTDANIKVLENEIDKLEKELLPLKNFILPGETIPSAHAHLARAVCRRAERVIICLNKQEPLNKAIIPYLNRLSDLLFMIARSEAWVSWAPSRAKQGRGASPSFARRAHGGTVGSPK